MKKNQGLVQVYTGNGKGKTTAAFGAALRMIGCGQRVGIVQFFKAPARESACRAFRKFGNKVRVWSFGGGFTWQAARETNAKAVAAAWAQCKKLLRDPRYPLVIFDEIHIALKYKFLETSEIVNVLKKRRAAKHVILTGRGAPAALLKVADLVTEMKCVRHPFREGVPARRGIEF